MAKVGRNDPCPCGSGRKYKHCCMRKHGLLKRGRLGVIFGDPELEDLTEALVTELVGAGWSEKRIRDLWTEGARYDRARDKLVIEGWRG